ncbi:MAG: hypothetical protein ABFD18_06925 [Syntrophomonas sp.]
MKIAFDLKTSGLLFIGNMDLGVIFIGQDFSVSGATVVDVQLTAANLYALLQETRVSGTQPLANIGVSIRGKNGNEDRWYWAMTENFWSIKRHYLISRFFTGDYC